MRLGVDWQACHCQTTLKLARVWVFPPWLQISIELVWEWRMSDAIVDGFAPEFRLDIQGPSSLSFRNFNRVMAMPSCSSSRLGETPVPCTRGR